MENLFKGEGSVHDVLKGLRKLNDVKPMTWKDMYEKYGGGVGLNQFAQLSDGAVFETPLNSPQRHPDYVVARDDEIVVYIVDIPDARDI